MSKKVVGGTLLFIGLIGIVGAFGVLNDQKQQATERAASISSVAKERSEKAKKESLKNEKKIASISLEKRQLEEDTSSNSTAVSKMKVNSKGDAAQIAFDYYKNQGRATHTTEMHVVDADIYDGTGFYSVPIFIDNQHTEYVNISKEDGTPSGPWSSMDKSNPETASSRFTDTDAATKAKEMVTDSDYVYTSTQVNDDGEYQVNFRYKQNQYPSIIRFDQNGNYLGRDGFDN